MEKIGNESDNLLWIIKWNDFLCSLRKTIGDDEMTVMLSKMEDLERIESISEIVDFKKLYSYLKQHQIDHARAWIFQFEKSMNEILKFALGRFNYSHEKGLEDVVVEEYEYYIGLINDKREVFSTEDIRDIPDTLKEALNFYLEYQTRVIDYEANLQYRRKYFIVRKGIEQIPKESLCINISWDLKGYIYVGKEYKDKFDALLKEIGYELKNYELDEANIHDKRLEDYKVNFRYSYIPYYDFHGDVSLTEAIYRYGHADFIEERAIIDAFEDEGRILE